MLYLANAEKGDLESYLRGNISVNNQYFHAAYCHENIDGSLSLFVHPQGPNHQVEFIVKGDRLIRK